MKKLFIFGILIASFALVSSSYGMNYIWLYRVGDYVEFRVPTGTDVNITVWGSNCGAAVFDFYENGAPYPNKKIERKGGSTQVPVSGGVYKLVVKKGQINVQVPDNASNIKYKQLPSPKKLCGMNITQPYKLPGQ